MLGLLHSLFANIFEWLAQIKLFGVNPNVLHVHPGAPALYTTTWLRGAQNAQLSQLPMKTGSFQNACNLSHKLADPAKQG